MDKRVIKPKCIICKKELKEAIVIPSRINNRSFEMLAKLSLPICEECKKREEDELIQWHNHHFNIQEIKELEKEKVIWHDLRKNPKDLPPKDVGTFSTFVITNKGIGYYVDCQNKWFVYWNVTGSYECSTEVVAWCELPKFEVEE